MSKPCFAVLGGGNAGFALSSDLALKGYKVNLCEIEDFKQSIEPVWKAGGITIRGVISNGFAKLNKVTTNFEEAISDVDVVMIVIPAYAQKRFAKESAPYLKEGQMVVLMPGLGGGALEFANELRSHGFNRNIKLAECSSFLFPCIKEGLDGVSVSGLKKDLPLAAFPARYAQEICDVLNQVYPKGFQVAQNVLDTSLQNLNNLMHPAGVICSAGRIESQGGNWSYYLEGTTESVCRIIEAVDTERCEVVKAYNLKPFPLIDQFRHFYGHQGMKGKDLYDMISHSPVHSLSKAPNQLRHRYLTEDIPYGNVFIWSMAKIAGVETPATHTVIHMASMLNDENYFETGRTAEKVGLGGKNKDQIIDYVTTSVESFK